MDRQKDRWTGTETDTQTDIHMHTGTYNLIQFTIISLRVPMYVISYIIRRDNIPVNREAEHVCMYTKASGSASGHQ